MRPRVVAAVTNFVLTVYAAVTAATMKMLHCVWAPGTAHDERRLYIRASVVCEYSGWQAP
jgi:hypothetical protein